METCSFKLKGADNEMERNISVFNSDVIERVSTYHRDHDEKSYWPPTLNRWFAKCGYSPVEQRFFCLVPYFCPTRIAKLLKKIEPRLELIPVVRELACGTNLVLYGRTAALV